MDHSQLSAMPPSYGDSVAGGSDPSTLPQSTITHGDSDKPPSYTSSNRRNSDEEPDYSSMDEHHYMRWYQSNGPTLRGRFNSARKRARSLLTERGIDATRGLTGTLANWTLGPSRPDTTELLGDLRKAKAIEYRKRDDPAFAQKSSHLGYNESELQSPRVEALTAWPEAMSELLAMSTAQDAHALLRVGFEGPNWRATTGAVRQAAARELSDFFGPCSDVDSNLSYRQRASLVASKLEAIAVADTGREEQGDWRAETAHKLRWILKGYAPLTAQRKSEIESSVWRGGLCHVRLDRGGSPARLPVVRSNRATATDTQVDCKSQA